MLSLGPRLAIVTLGPKGAIVAVQANGKPEIHHIEAPKVEAVDTTGAGDCFCGSFAHFFNANPDGDVLEMVRKAINIAAISVQRKGTQSSYPSLDELKALKIV
uniref:Carbohydrate kinase PfkB domain-containing protein n=1 Tax=Acrobeloides nanus TaxID=290746 RepID=A0A914DES7_9BILA